LASPEAWALFVGGSAGEAKLTSDHDAYKNSVWVRRCVDSVARSIARLPIHIYAGDQQLEKHELLTLLGKPSEQMTEFEFMYLTVASIQLWGESFWLKGQRGLGLPKTLTLVMPTMMKEETNKGRLTGWTIEGAGKTVKPDDVVHIKLPNPFNVWRGAAPMEAAKLAITSDLAAMRHNLQFFQNGAVPRGVLVTEKVLQKGVADQVLDQFEDRHKNNSHRPALLHGGLTFQETQMSAADMEFEQSRKFSREEILAAFGVPPIEVGLLEYASYDNARAQRRAYWETTLIPITHLIADAIVTQLLGGKGITVELSTDQVEELRESVTEKILTAKSMIELGMDPEDVNNQLDLGSELPFYKLDTATSSQVVTLLGEYAAGNLSEKNTVTILRGLGVPLSVAKELVANTEIKPDPEPEPTPPVPTPDPDGSEEPDNSDSAENTEPDEHSSTETNDEEDSPPDETARSLKKKVREGEPPLVSKVNGIIDGMNDLLKTIEKKYATEAYLRGLAQMRELLGSAAGSFGVADPVDIAFLEGKVINVKNIADTLKNNIRESLMEGLLSGEGVDAIADRVRDVYNENTKRAKTIARTEISQCANAARMHVLQKDISGQHECLSADDGGNREHSAQQH